jgi:hypothetical protein
MHIVNSFSVLLPIGLGVCCLTGRQSVIFSNHRGDLDWLIGLMVGRVVKTVSLNMYRRP